MSLSEINALSGFHRVNGVLRERAFTGDDFIGANEDTPNDDYWLAYGVDSATLLNSIYGNKLRLGTVNAQGYAYVKALFLLVGDFDIESNWEMEVDSGGERAEFYLQVYILSTGYFARIGYQPNLNVWRARYNKGSTTTVDSAETIGINDPRKFRLVRSGSNILMYKWTTEWVLVTTASGIGTGDATAYLVSHSYADTPTITVDFDDIIINSGTVSLENTIGEICGVADDS